MTAIAPWLPLVVAVLLGVRVRVRVRVRVKVRVRVRLGLRLGLLHDGNCSLASACGCGFTRGSFVIDHLLRNRSQLACIL